jgi:ABC-type transport system involved in multi-copper enzyme maturation permease subunit
LYIVGAIGAMAALTTLGTAFSDLAGMPDLVLPYGVVAGLLIGFPLLCAFIGLEGSDSDLGYRSAQAVGVVGLVIFAVGLVRSALPFIAREFFDTTTIPSFLLPSGFFLMTVGALFFLLGATLASDNRFLVMTRRELASLFFSPIAYVVLAGMAVMGWLSFVLFMSMIAPDTNLMGQQPRPMPEPIIRYYFLGFVALVCLIAAVPMLTMRLLSEEQRSGTLEVLLVAPVTETQIVLSKFFAAWLFFMLAWTLWVAFPLALRIIGSEPFDYRPMLSFYVGMGAMGTGFLSMGLFFSSVTRNQVIALFLTLAVMILLTVLVIFMFYAMDDPAASQTKKDALGYVSYYHHIDEFVQGRVHPRFILFHLSLAVFWLYLTVKVLEARKWR